MSPRNTGRGSRAAHGPIPHEGTVWQAATRLPDYQRGYRAGVHHTHMVRDLAAAKDLIRLFRVFIWWPAGGAVLQAILGGWLATAALAAVSITAVFISRSTAKRAQSIRTALARLDALREGPTDQQGNR